MRGKMMHFRSASQLSGRFFTVGGRDGVDCLPILKQNFAFYSYA